MNRGPKPELDDLDQRLIAILSQDARLSNRKIADRLNVTEGTVRGRIKKLQQERLIAFTAVTSPDLEGNSKLAFIGVLAELDQVDELAKKIAELPDIRGTLVTMGRFNIFAICLFTELDQLYDTASELILAMPGVNHVETVISVKAIKYESRIARITEESHSSDN